ncbi:hypothetical protein phi32_1 [Escherichia phage phiEco32]|uniref:Uncharacterized protein n=1 Tax=Escherichia phage Phieco32 TaxID=2679905 RepID=B0FIG3_BPE32|nr:hypothetical protein phi32_1 [Escherichia phage phiEco32]ABY52802.1 hypothetical protein phi32_1 [Escherichia phage phiEco32]
MSTIGYAKLTGMKEFTPFISPLGDVVNVVSLNTAHGWIGLNVTWPLWGCLNVKSPLCLNFIRGMYD